MSILAHQASVTPIASNAVPATIGYRELSLSLGGGRMSLHATTEMSRASSVSLHTLSCVQGVLRTVESAYRIIHLNGVAMVGPYSYRSDSAGRILAADHDG